MYIPDGVELTKAEQLDLVNRKQGIDYGNTRFKANPFNERQSKEAITELAKTQVREAYILISIRNLLQQLTTTKFMFLRQIKWLTALGLMEIMYQLH